MSILVLANAKTITNYKIAGTFFVFNFLIFFILYLGLGFGLETGFPVPSIPSEAVWLPMCSLEVSACNVLVPCCCRACASLVVDCCAGPSDGEVKTTGGIGMAGNTLPGESLLAGCVFSNLFTAVGSKELEKIG